MWSILVGHAAYSWGVLCHHPELHTVCFLYVFIVQRCVCTRTYAVYNAQGGGVAVGPFMADEKGGGSTYGTFNVPL